MPKDIEPMLATLVDEVPTDEQNWIYDIKWDGYRPPGLFKQRSHRDPLAQ